MFKRAGRFAAIPLAIAMFASLTVAGTVSAKPWKTVTISQTGPCTFSVWYSWTSMGHGGDLTAAIGISAVDAGGSSTVATFAAPHKSGSNGVLNHEFVITGQQYAYQFMAWGELSIPSKSQVIAKSVALSTNMLPVAPVICA